MTQGVRLDRVQRGLFLVASTLVTAGVASAATWVGQQHPRGADDLMTLEMTSGPSPGHRIGEQSDVTLKPPDTVVVRVTAGTVGNRVWLRLNGFEHWYDIVAGGTEADRQLAARDALIASVNANHAAECVASISDPNELLITANFFGGLWSLELFGDLLAGDGVFSDNAVNVTTGRENGLLTITTYSKSRELRNGARNMMMQILAEFRKTTTVDTLARYGMALGQRGVVVNLDAIQGGSWETSAACTFAIGVESYIVAPVDLIETVNLTLTVFEAPAITAATITESIVATAP